MRTVNKYINNYNYNTIIFLKENTITLTNSEIHSLTKLIQVMCIMELFIISHE